MLLSDLILRVGQNQVQKIYLGTNQVYGGGISTEEYVPGSQAANTTVTYTNEPGSPTVSTDENGDVIDFVMNSTAELDGSTGVDTGVIPFDGTGLTTIYLKCTVDISELFTSAQNYMLSAYKAVNGVTSGFGFYFNTSSNHYLYAFFGDGSGTNTWLNLNSGSGTASSSASTYYTPSSGEHIYEITITQNSGSSWTFALSVDETSVYSETINVSLTNDDLEVMVGQRKNPNTGAFAGFCSMTVNEFTVTKNKNVT